MRTRNLEIPRCAMAHLRFALSARPGMTTGSTDEYDRVCASVSRRVCRRLRVRPRRLRHRADGAGDLALCIAAFGRGAAGPDLFDRRANLDDAVVLAIDPLLAGVAMPDGWPRRRAAGHHADRTCRPTRFQIELRRAATCVSDRTLFEPHCGELWRPGGGRHGRICRRHPRWPGRP